MRLIYNILFLFFFALSAPYYFWKMWRRGDWQAGFGQRFARYTPEFLGKISGQPLLWLHAVSMGEVGVCLQLIEALEKALPGWQILVSTTTSTGMGELQKRLPPHVLRMYYPVDLPWNVGRAFAVIRPRAIVLVEAEIWPNFLWQGIALKASLFLANARLSERSFKGYQRFAFLFRPIFKRFSGVGAQQTWDAERLAGLGFPEKSVVVTGNLKFDGARPKSGAGFDARSFLRSIGVAEDALIIVAGSTHAGEEALLGEMFQRLKARFPKLFLVIVPRHFERTREVSEALTARRVAFCLRTEPKPGVDCLVVNTNGELRFFYETASVVFVGKSITADGGQNPIEPAALGKAVVFGPNMQNFLPIVRAYLAEHAVLQVADAAGLEAALGDLLADVATRASFGARARAVTEKNFGATQRTVDLILRGLPAAPK